MVEVDISELKGKYLWQLPHWSHSKELQLEVQNVVQKVKKGNPISFETSHVDSKGDIKNMDFSLTPVHNENGDLLYIVPEGTGSGDEREPEACRNSSGYRLPCQAQERRTHYRDEAGPALQEKTPRREYKRIGNTPIPPGQLQLPKRKFFS